MCPFERFSSQKVSRLLAGWERFESPATFQKEARATLTGLISGEVDAVTLRESLFAATEMLLDGSDADRLLASEALKAAKQDYATAFRAGYVSIFWVWLVQLLSARVDYRIGKTRRALQVGMDIERRLVGITGSQEALLESVRSAPESELSYVAVYWAGIMPALIRAESNRILSDQLWPFCRQVVTAHVAAVEADRSSARTDRTLAVVSTTIKLLADRGTTDLEFLAKLEVINQTEREGLARFEATKATSDAAAARIRGDAEGEKRLLAHAVLTLWGTPLLRQLQLAASGSW